MSFGIMRWVEGGGGHIIGSSVMCFLNIYSIGLRWETACNAEVLEVGGGGGGGGVWDGNNIFLGTDTCTLHSTRISMSIPGPQRTPQPAVCKISSSKTH